MQNQEGLVAQTLSLEEEHQLLTEAASVLSELDSDLAENDRMIQTSQAFESMGLIAEKIVSATPTELALIETLGDMSVTGTDVKPETVVPAMEEYLGRTISAESFRGIAKRLWDSTQATLSDIWKKLDNFWSNIFDVLPSLNKRVEEMGVEAENRTDTMKRRAELNYDPRVSVRALTCNNKIFSNGNELVSQIEDLTTAVTFVNTTYIKSLNNMGKKITASISSFNGNNAKEVIRKMDATLDDGLAEMLKVPNGNRVGSVKEGADFFKGKPLLGDMSLVSRFSYRPNGYEPDVSMLSHYRQSKMGISTNGFKNQAGRKPPILKPEEVKSVTAKLTELLKAVNLLKTGGGLTQLHSTRDELYRATRSLTTKDLGEGSKTLYRELTNFNSTYATWVKGPATHLANLVMFIVRSILTICKASLQCFAIAAGEIAASV